MRWFRSAILAALVALPLALDAAPLTPEAAQAPGARFTIEGKVLDATRMPVAGAQVTTVADDGGAGPSAVTDQRGAFTLVVDPGRYTVKVVAGGFVEASQRVTARQTGVESQEFVLAIEGLREAVTVSAAAATVWRPSTARPRHPRRCSTYSVGHGSHRSTHEGPAC